MAALAPNGAVILGPERNKAAEIGTKWELFDRHLLVTGALFQTEKDNARETVNGTARSLQSGAAYQVEGIDLEVERQDHRSLERVRRSGADEVEGHAERDPSATSGCRWPTSPMNPSAC